MRAARGMGLITVGLGGGDRGGLPELSDCLLLVPSAVTARIQEVHITLGHMLCAAIETACGGAQDELPHTLTTVCPLLQP